MLTQKRDGLQSAAANGDDNNTGATTIGSCQTTGDDEDGVVFPAGLVAGQSASVEVTAAGSSSAGAILDAWCDWDQSGAWEPGEDFETIIGAGPIALSGGGTTDTLNFTVPPSSAAGTTNCRFRVSTGGGLNTQGLATNGEVEDHRVGIEVIAEDRDWADAPDPNYPTLSVPPDATPPDGASHLIGGDVSPFMGKCVDAEGDGQQSVGAVGDDTGASSTTIGSCAQANDDEDGVTIGTLTPWQHDGDGDDRYVGIAGGLQDQCLDRFQYRRGLGRSRREDPDRCRCSRRCDPGSAQLLRAGHGQGGPIVRALPLQQQRRFECRGTGQAMGKWKITR